MTDTYPKISYCIMTYNEEKNIKGCLDSIFSQNYPKDKLEVIIVDDKSTDKTVEIAQKYPVKILTSGKHDADLSTTIGFNKATGKYFRVGDADIQLRGKNWFKEMIRPLEENPDMPAVFTKFYPHPNDSLLNKYYNLDPLQRDLIYQTFSIGFDQVISEKRNDYYICRYSPGKIPPQTHGLYRRSTMRKIIEQEKIWHDMGNLISLVNSGYTKFGYIPDTGYYHFHATSLKSLINKRIRNIHRSYFRYDGNQWHWKWFDLNKSKDRIKIALLVILANLFFPILLLSIIKMIKSRNIVYLIEAPLTLILVDVIIWTFLKEKKGRALILTYLTRIFTKKI